MSYQFIKAENPESKFEQTQQRMCEILTAVLEIHRKAWNKILNEKKSIFLMKKLKKVKISTNDVKNLDQKQIWHSGAAQLDDVANGPNYFITRIRV